MRAFWLTGVEYACPAAVHQRPNQTDRMDRTIVPMSPLIGRPHQLAAARMILDATGMIEAADLGELLASGSATNATLHQRLEI
jgi:hypothetical protein